QVPSMSASSASPCLVFKRYFLSQMSTDAGCIGTSWSVPAIVFLTASSRTVLMLLPSPSSCPVVRDPVSLSCDTGWPAPTAKPQACLHAMRCHRPDWPVRDALHGNPLPVRQPGPATDNTKYWAKPACATPTCCGRQATTLRPPRGEVNRS